MMFFYSVFDAQLKRYVSPFLAESDLSALAMVRDACVPGSVLYRFSDMFELHRLSSWDESYGIPLNASADIVIHDGVQFSVPFVVCRVSEILLKEKESGCD